MIYIALIYVFAVVLYNFQPGNANEITINMFGNDVPIWRFHINFFRNFTMAYAFFYLAKISVQKFKRNIFFGAGLVAGATTLFHCCLLIGASGIEKWISAMNNYIWSIIFGIFGIVILLSLRYTMYDKGGS